MSRYAAYISLYNLMDNIYVKKYTEKYNLHVSC